MDSIAVSERPTDRTLYRDTVASVADRAKAAMDATLHGRIDKAMALVLAGDVELLPNGKAQVASQANGQTIYYVVNGTCSCRDFPQAPEGWCKHRLGAGIAKRTAQALTLADERFAALSPAPDTGCWEPVDEDGTPCCASHEVCPGHPPVIQTPVPRAPGTIPAAFLVELHGKQFVTYSGLLAMAHAHGLQSLQARFVSVTSDLALAEATATFADGRTFGDSADSTPANVGSKVKAHFPRLALTRAKARCLRDALNIAMCSVEELAD